MYPAYTQIKSDQKTADWLGGIAIFLKKRAIEKGKFQKNLAKKSSFVKILRRILHVTICPPPPAKIGGQKRPKIWHKKSGVKKTVVYIDKIWGKINFFDFCGQI